MVVDVFVAEGDGKETLGEEMLLGVGDENGMSRIVNDRIDSFRESEFLIDLLEEECSGVGGNLAAVEMDVDFFAVGRDD